jgi:peroxiredoxin
MRLKAGQQAPLFEVDDAYGRRVSLAPYAGRRLLVSFYRAAVCPLCNLRFLYLLDHEDAYRRNGLHLMAFFDSSAESVHRYLDRYDPPFPVIADSGRKVYSLYGLETSWLGVMHARLMRGAAYREAAQRQAGGSTLETIFQAEGSFTRMPGDFLLDPDLRIHTAYYGRDAGDFLSFFAIQNFLVAASREADPRLPPDWW